MHRLRYALTIVLLTAIVLQPTGSQAILQPIKGGLWIPAPTWATNSNPAFSTVQLDAAGDRAALIFRAPVTCDLDRVTFGVGTVATAAALDVRIETVNTATGVPSGTLWDSPTNTTTATSGAPVTNTPIEVTLTAVAQVARGNLVAVVVQPNTTPIDVLLNRFTMSGGANAGGATPYGSFNTTGSYVNSIALMNAAVRCSTGEWIYLADGVAPVSTLNGTNAFNTGTSATTGTRRGLRFQVPFAAKLSGTWFKASVVNGADYTVVLYDNAGTVLATLATVDGNQLVGGASQHAVYFVSDYTLVKNTEYYLAIVAGTATSITLYEYSVSDAAYFDATPGGQDFHLAKYVSDAWVEVPTERPWMGILLTAFHDASPTSGGSHIIGSPF